MRGLEQELALRDRRILRECAKFSTPNSRFYSRHSSLICYENDMGRVIEINFSPQYRKLIKHVGNEKIGSHHGEGRGRGLPCPRVYKMSTGKECEELPSIGTFSNVPTYRYNFKTSRVLRQISTFAKRQ